MEQKTWYTSKTIWINLLAAIALLVQHFTHYVIDVSVQAAALVVINFILRIVTKEEVVWSLKKKSGCCCNK